MSENEAALQDELLLLEQSFERVDESLANLRKSQEELKALADRLADLRSEQGYRDG